jgi:hypothetical protein
VKARLDRCGRRIGRNWWREFNTDVWRHADHAWWLAREAVANGWATEQREFAEVHPRPTLKGFLLANAGMAGHP